MHPVGRAPLVWAQWASVGIATLGVALALTGALWTADHLQADATLRRAALFAHLASLVVGFGSVLAVDWVALLWVLRRRPLADVLQTAGNVHGPIWFGYTGLVASGMLLEPDLANPVTRVKLALVLVIGWNGVLAAVLHRRLARRPEAPLEGRLAVTAAGAATVSQLGWWGAMALGFLNGL